MSVHAPAAPPATGPHDGVEDVLRRSRRLPVRSTLLLVALVVFTVVSLRRLDLTLGELWRAVPRFAEFVADAWPPDFEGLGRLTSAAFFTLQMAFLGTLIATVASAPLAVLAARNTTPARPVALATRAFVLVCRAIPDFVFALMFVAAVGLGPLPGVLGLAIHSVGMLAKVYAERIEEIDPGPVEALEAMGARRSQTIRLAVLPQVAPSVLANTLYRLDINIRSSIVLGLVGAGGIGYELITALQGLQYQRAFAVIVVVLVLVGLVECASSRLRKEFL